jgi:hypothetical protein
MLTGESMPVEGGAEPRLTQASWCGAARRGYRKSDPDRIAHQVRTHCGVGAYGACKSPFHADSETRMHIRRMDPRSRSDALLYLENKIASQGLPERMMLTNLRAGMSSFPALIAILCDGTICSLTRLRTRTTAAARWIALAWCA